MTEEKTIRQIRYTVKNARTGQLANFTLTDDITEMSQGEVEKLVEKGIRLSRRGTSATLELVKMRVVVKRAASIKRKNTNTGNTRNHSEKVTPEDEPVLFISVAQARRCTSKTIAEKLTQYLDEAPEDQVRIDEVLFLLRFTLLVRTSKKLKVKKILEREDFEKLLARIYSREQWSEAMIAAFWEIRLLFAKKDQKSLKIKLQQEVERMNGEKGQAVFTQQGQYLEEMPSTIGFSFVQMLREIVKTMMGLAETQRPLEWTFG